MPKAKPSTKIVAVISLANMETNKVWVGVVVADPSKLEPNTQLVTIWGDAEKNYVRYRRHPLEDVDHAMVGFENLIKHRTGQGWKQVALGYAPVMQQAFKHLVNMPLTVMSGNENIYPPKKVPLVSNWSPTTVSGSVNNLGDWVITGDTIITSAMSAPLLMGNTAGHVPPGTDMDCTTCHRWPAVWAKVICARCGKVAINHNAGHPHEGQFGIECVGFVAPGTLDLPPEKSDPVFSLVKISDNPIPHLECSCGHCMNSHGQIDGMIPCLVAGCTCEVYRHRCPECDYPSVDGGWNHDTKCVTGFRLMPSQQGVRKLHRQPRRTSDLVDEDL